MQNFMNQAYKNGVTLLNSGSCQLCGANYQGGIFECMDNYHKGLEFLDFHSGEFLVYKFLSVDAHALQHPEIHGRWSNHFHLTRLNLILDKKQTWDYQKSPLLSDYLNVYKSTNPTEVLEIPNPLERGSISAKDLLVATTPKECMEQIKKWSEEVYQAWSANHFLVSTIAEGFLEKKNHHKSENR